MFNLNEIEELYKKEAFRKIQSLAEKIKQFSFVEDCIIDGASITVRFKEEVDIENQDILGVFIYGGVIKKANTDGKNEDNYIKVEGIGEI